MRLSLRLGYGPRFLVRVELQYGVPQLDLKIILGFGQATTLNPKVGLPFGCGSRVLGLQRYIGRIYGILGLYRDNGKKKKETTI